MHRFLIVIENAGNNFSAYSPDLPGCVASGATREETERQMYEAIQMHVEGLKPIRVASSRSRNLTWRLACLDEARPRGRELPASAARGYGEAPRRSSRLIDRERRRVAERV